MIWGHVKEAAGLNQDYMRCISFIRENPLETMENGRYEIDGDRIFVNVAEFRTREAEEIVFEAHRKYADMHYIIAGSERIWFAKTERLEAEPYEPDICMLHGEPEGYADLRPGDFLICEPEDAHAPGRAVRGAEPVKKATFKILL